MTYQLYTASSGDSRLDSMLIPDHYLLTVTLFLDKGFFFIAYLFAGCEEGNEALPSTNIIDSLGSRIGRFDVRGARRRTNQRRQVLLV